MGKKLSPCCSIKRRVFGSLNIDLCNAISDKTFKPRQINSLVAFDRDPQPAIIEANPPVHVSGMVSKFECCGNISRREHQPLLFLEAHDNRPVCFENQNRAI